MKRPLAQGVAFGGLGAIAGAVAGYHARKSLSRDKPNFAVAVLEDTLAIVGGVVVAALTAATD